MAKVRVRSAVLTCPVTSPDVVVRTRPTPLVVLPELPAKPEAALSSRTTRLWAVLEALDRCRAFNTIESAESGIAKARSEPTLAS